MKIELFEGEKKLVVLILTTLGLYLSPKILNILYTVTPCQGLNLIREFENSDLDLFVHYFIILGISALVTIVFYFVKMSLKKRVITSVSILILTTCFLLLSKTNHYFFNLDLRQSVCNKVNYKTEESNNAFQLLDFTHLNYEEYGYLKNHSKLFPEIPKSSHDISAQIKINNGIHMEVDLEFYCTDTTGMNIKYGTIEVINEGNQKKVIIDRPRF